MNQLIATVGQGLLPLVGAMMTLVTGATRASFLMLLPLVGAMMTVPGPHGLAHLLRVAAPRRGDDDGPHDRHVERDADVAAPRRGDDDRFAGSACGSTDRLLPLVGAMMTT